MNPFLTEYIGKMRNPYLSFNDGIFSSEYDHFMVGCSHVSHYSISGQANTFCVGLQTANTFTIH